MSVPIKQYSSTKQQRVKRHTILVLIMIAMQGCATTSVFIAYPGKVQPLLNKVNQNGTIDLPPVSTSSGPDEVLDYLEKGRLAQITQQPELSKSYFKLAIAYFNQLSHQAQISATDIGQQSTSLLLNDNIINYQIPGYEQLYVHHFQALNYLFEGNLEAAGVEVRRANQVQKKIKTQYEADLSKARQRAEELPINIGPAEDQVNALFSTTEHESNKIKSSFDNGYAFYASALIYELRGEYDHAYIDYKKALAINPSNQILLRDVQRVARQLGRHEDLARITAEVGPPMLKESNDAEIIIFYEAGFVPAKTDVTIPITNYHDRAVVISFPMYQQPLSNHYPLELYTELSPPTISYPLTNTYILASTALKERSISTIVRQVGRAITKVELTHKSEKAGGNVGAVLASIYNLVSEQADLRSWLSLPYRVDVIRKTIKPGTKEVVFRPQASTLSKTVPLNIEPNTVTVIQLTNTGNQLFSRTTTYDRQ